MSADLTKTAVPRPKHWLLLKTRQWHAWAGLFAAVFLLIASLTGAVLNYKKPVLQALGLEKAPIKAGATSEAFLDAWTAETIGQMPVGFGQAIKLAGARFGNTPLERVELKGEHGDWVYKVKARNGEEVWISATSGAQMVKGEYEKVYKGADGVPEKRFDWGKVLIDLHTGKIGGPIGRALMTAVAIILSWLTLSGLYVYVKPKLIRRARGAEARRPVSRGVDVSGKRLAGTQSEA